MRRVLAPLMLVTAFVAAPAVAQQADQFDHPQHAKVFPTCTACHSGALDDSLALLPSGQGCATCHDGDVERKVDWKALPPMGTNLRFTHTEHRKEVLANAGQDSTLNCQACHTPDGSGWMTVEPAVMPQCLTCHGIKAEHLAAPDTACATCHLTLAQATSLTMEQVREFPAPSSHDAPGFMGPDGHGVQAKAGTGPKSYLVAPSCATCHAQNFCITCHVNAPETPTIQALARDPRSLAIPVKFEAPATHAPDNFVLTHGKTASKNTVACQTCHTQESCLTCHLAAPPRSIATLYASGPGRGTGAQVERSRPPSHMADFSTIHATPASSNPQSCEGCHARPQCLDCHRGTPDRTPQYHPQTFLERHPAAAYARETNCSDCHNSGAFCQTCHVQSGLGSPNGPLKAGYHDVFPGFLLNHGQAARQSLESCTSCHVEKDCLTCHSALYGRGFNPHGPGFDGDQLRSKNPQMCTVCHGQRVPSAR